MATDERPEEKGDALPPTGWDAVTVLAVPTRRQVFETVRTARAPVTREEAAAATGISRRLAAFHLDHLAKAGLLTVDFARPAGRRGPGAGRPAKRYAATSGEISVSLPARRYDLAARILAAGIARSGTGDDRRDPVAATLAAAASEGHRIGEQCRPPGRLSTAQTLTCARQALAALGYEPARTPTGLRMANCPFDAVADVAPTLVCAMNQHFVGGLLAGLRGHPGVVALLKPAPPDCCVQLVASA